MISSMYLSTGFHGTHSSTASTLEWIPHPTQQQGKGKAIYSAFETNLRGVEINQTADDGLAELSSMDYLQSSSLKPALCPFKTAWRDPIWMR